MIEFTHVHHFCSHDSGWIGRLSLAESLNELKGRSLQKRHRLSGSYRHTGKTGRRNDGTVCNEYFDRCLVESKRGRCFHAAVMPNLCRRQLGMFRDFFEGKQNISVEKNFFSVRT